MQQYKSHKTVKAGKITAISRIVKNSVYQHGWLTLEDGRQVSLGQPYFDKHNPEVGGYFVQHEDGYQSFSPAAVFELGYTQVNNVPRTGAEISDGLKQVLASFGVDVDMVEDEEVEDDEDLVETLYTIEDKLNVVIAQNEKILNLLNSKVVTLSDVAQLFPPKGGITNFAQNSL